MTLRWQVIEDNGGGLHLAAFDGERVIFYGHGYEHNEDGLRADLEALRNGADPRADAWEMPVGDPQAAYGDLTRYDYGWTVVADNEGVYYDRMGAAAHRVFSGKGNRKELAAMTNTDMTHTDTLGRDLFAIYRRHLAASLECGEDELPAVTARLADEDFDTLSSAQNTAEEAAWGEARQDPDWDTDAEDAIAEAFQRLRYEAGY